MNKVIITSDSGLDPINELTMIPCQLTNNNIGYRDNHIEINNKKILTDAQNGIYYKTSAPLLIDFQDMFLKYVREGYDIVHLSMSNKISSSSVSNSNIIANELNDEYGKHIYVVDTLTGATGGTLINELANDLVNKSLTAKEIKEILDEEKTNIKTSFYVPNPMGFIRSGRNAYALSLAEKAIKLFKVKFRVNIDEHGKLGMKDTYKGKNNISFYKMLNDILQNINEIDLSRIVIGTVEEQDIDMKDIKNKLENEYNAKVFIKNINSCIATYGSPDLIGISYKTKNSSI